MITLFTTLYGYISSYLSTQITISYGAIFLYYFIYGALSVLNEEIKFTEKVRLSLLKTFRYIKKELIDARRT
jgi:hypothetical protein